MEADETPQPPKETVEGLDPRALFAWATSRFDVASLLRAWEPPPVEQVAPLFPQYELLALIGRGGMGAVYRARQAGLDREVAIKLMPPEAAADDDFAARFRVEARALAKLQHPNIVAIYEFGQTSEGHLYFVMEYVDGTDLAHLITSGELRPAQALEIVSRVCDALQFAHASGVVHRDIKPANVLVDRSGAVKVADFGLAKLHPESDVRRSRHSVPGSVIGTPDYMAPEQLDGREVDARSDIFSLGVMLYEMLTGQLPRGAWEPPSRKAHTDARLDGVVNKALQTEPARRYQQASEVRTAVDGIRASPTRRGSQRWLIVVALVLLAGVAGWRLFPGAHPERSAAGAESKDPEELRATPFAVSRGTSTPALRASTQDDRAILTGLDLRTSVVSGGWSWKDGLAGGTLTHPRVSPTSALRVGLPVRPAGRAYKLSFDLLLQTSQSDVGVILPIGTDTRAGVILNLNGASGLGLVKGARWDQNPTTTNQALNIGTPLHVVLKVGPYGQRATIMAEIENRLLIRWEGERAELSIFDSPKLGWELPDPQTPGFVSYGGGIEISAVEVEYLQPLR